MATSGTTTFTRSRDQIITSALRKVSAFESGETPDSDAITDASAALNSLLKHWQGSGVCIWTAKEAILFPQVAQTSYILGASTDHATDTWAETELTAAAANGASTITVASIAGIAATYKIGVQLDSGTFQWTTVNGAPVGSTVTLTAALTGAAASGNLVVAYQTDLVRPLQVISARRHNFDSGSDTPLEEMARAEYQDMPNKTTQSTINSYYYDRRGGSTTTGLFYVWPAPSTVTEAVKMTIMRPIEIFSASGNDADIPQEWIRALEWGLADEIADEYDVPEPKRTRIERRAAQYLQEANWGEKELMSFQLVPDTTR
jgi:hypothetical protein